MKTSHATRRACLALAILIIACCVAQAVDGPQGSWNEQDIGNTGATGSAVYENGEFTITGAGEDLWDGSADAVHYVYRTWNGDCAFIARITQFANPDAGPKAGIMFRAGLDPSAANAFVMFRPGGATDFQWRGQSGDTGGGGGIWTSLPYWLKLVRRDNTFSAYDSNDGQNWRLIASLQIQMPDPFLIGFAVNSHQYAVNRNATFDNIQFSGRPATPTGLTALRAFDSIHLSWSDNSTNEYRFSLFRRNFWSTNFEPLMNFGTNVTTAADVTNFISTEIFDAYFRVQAVGLMESDLSEIATAQSGVLDPVPPTWSTADIGDAGVPGGENFRDGVFRVAGSGADIGDTNDQCHFVYQSLTGDGEIISLWPGYYVESFFNYNAKGGLMFRESLAPDSANAFVFLTPGNGAGIQARTHSGEATEYIPILEWNFPELWLRLTRSNNTFNAYMAGTGGTNWTLLASREINMSNTALVGMAVTSHTNTILQTSSFSNVTVVPSGGLLRVRSFTDNTISLMATGMFDRVYGLDWSADLTSNSWRRLLTVTNRTGTFPFSDPMSPGNTKRFYRVCSQSVP